MFTVVLSSVIIKLKFKKELKKGDNLQLDKIEELKKEKDIAILAHYYVDEKIQAVADYVGDSFYLAKIAQEIPQKTIVMAGVYFMGESLKIMNPEKKVLMPDLTADCPMAHMVDLELIEKYRKEYPDLAVVCYINSTAKVKTYSDVCVTSSNAEKIVNALDSKNIFFIPDGNLGHYIVEKCKDKNIILNKGCCPIHDKITEEMIIELKELHPSAKILAHPECRPEILKHANYIGSTSGILEYPKKDSNRDYIIVTEEGIFYELNKMYPYRNFIGFDHGFICHDMKKINMDNLIYTMETEENEIFVPEEIAEKALIPLNRMMEMGGN